MPLIASSDLGLHCLPKSHKKDTRLIWVNYQLKPVFWVLKRTVSSKVLLSTHNMFLRENKKSIMRLVIGELSNMLNF